MNRDQWLREFCERLGVEPPSPEEADQLLELAAIAAHGSERPAAPLACWAAGKTGRSPPSCARSPAWSIPPSGSIPRERHGSSRLPQTFETRDHGLGPP